MARTPTLRLSPTLRPAAPRHDSAHSASPRKKRSLRPAATRPSPHASSSSSPAFTPRQDLAPRAFEQGATGLDDDIFAPPGWRERRDLGMSSDDEDENQVMSGRKAPRQGPAVPLAELPVEEMSEDGEREYPPSPKKSPVKRRLVFGRQDAREEEARARGSFGFRDVSPEEWRDLAVALPEVRGARAKRGGRRSLMRRRRTSGVRESVGLTDLPSFQAPEAQSVPIGLDGQVDSREESKPKDVSLEERLWDACGRDVERWNSGDFDQRLDLGFDIGTVRW